MSEVTTWPWLPTELIENIISEVWSSSLSTNDRITLMTSSLLVNKTWMVAFTRISSKDVHIPCPSYIDQYLRILREESPIYDEHSRSLPDRLCRSLTFRVGYTPPGHDAAPSGNEPQMAKALSDMMYTLHTISYLPNLRRVSIEYVNWGFDDVFDQYRLIAFPAQVTNLELDYTFSQKTPPWLIGALRSNQERHMCLPWSLPSIRHLSIQGAGEAFLIDMVSACPNIQSFTTDAYIRLGAIMPLPDAVQMVTLRESTSMPLTREGMDGYNLIPALDGAFFSVPTSSLKIVIESGIPDAAVWDEHREMCGERGVQLIHRAL